MRIIQTVNKLMRIFDEYNCVCIGTSSSALDFFLVRCRAPFNPMLI